MLWPARVEEHRPRQRHVVSLAGSDDFLGLVRVADQADRIGSLYLAPRLDRLSSAHPSLKLDLVTSAQPLNLSYREADLFLSFFRPRGRGLRIQKIGEFGLRLYASPAHLKRRGTPATIKDLPEHVFVGYIDDLVAIDAVRWLSDVIKDPEIVFHSNSMTVQHHAAAAGLGIVLLPLFAAAGDKKLRPVLADQETVTRELWLSVHHDLHDIPRVRSVIDFIVGVIAAD